MKAITWRSDGARSHAFADGGDWSLCSKVQRAFTVEDEAQMLGESPMDGDCRRCWQRARKKVKR